MWAFDFLLAEPKAKTLQTHLKANNVFLRWWLHEYYLPDDMRLGTKSKFARFILALSVYIVVVSFWMLRTDSKYYDECKLRESCYFACIDDNFPRLGCVRSKDHYLMYGLNKYVQLYKWPKKKNGSNPKTFEQCLNTVPPRIPTWDTIEKELYDGRQPRTQVCFEGCSPPVSLDLSLYNRTWDSRPREGTAACNAERDNILCVDPTDELCERATYADEVCVGDSGLCVQFTIVFLSILVSIPVSVLLDVTLIFILYVRPPSIQDFHANTTKCSAQMFYVLIGFIHLMLLTSSLVKVLSQSRPEMLAFTFLIVVAVDQVRNILMQALTWFFLIRRCGQVPIMNEEVEFADDEDDEVLSPVELFFQILTMVVESRRFNIGTYVFVGFYAVFLIIWMSISSPELDPQVELTLKHADTVLLALFILEILMRMLVIGIWYLRDFWNTLDATVVIISFVFNLQDAATGGGLALLRMLRLLRLALMLRKVSAEDKPAQRADGGLQFSSPVERVLKIFGEIKHTKGLPNSLKDQVDWAVDCISSNKLYSISVDLEKLKSGEGFLDQEVGDWMRLACVDPGEKYSYREMELEKLLMGGGRAKMATRAELVDEAQLYINSDIEDVLNRHNTPEQLEELQADLDSLGYSTFGDNYREVEVTAERHSRTTKKKSTEIVNPRVVVAEALLSYMDDHIEEWDFDVHIFEKMCFEKPITLLLMHACVRKDLYTVFEIPPDSLHEFCNAIEQGYVKKNPYHNSTHAADTIQSFNVLFHWFEATPFAHNKPADCALQEEELLAGLLAALVHDFEHPGFSNNFIIRTKHPMSIRYNDISVLENHHVSAGFNVMQSIEPDPLGHCTETQYENVRFMMISMILATDIANHFLELSSFKNKLNTKGFPTAKPEDKQILLNILLHSCDISNPGRILSTYLKWVPRVMEEFFRQGDLEKARNMQISMFYNRENTSIPQCQKGFMEVVVLPTFSVLAELVPKVGEVIMPNLEANYTHYAEELADGTDVVVVKSRRYLPSFQGLSREKAAVLKGCAKLQAGCKRRFRLPAKLRRWIDKRFGKTHSSFLGKMKKQLNTVRRSVTGDTGDTGDTPAP